MSTHTDMHTHPCAVSCLCKVICRGEDDCSPSWWPWQRLTACIHRWRWMQWVRSAAGVSCLFQGTLALMTWLIACPGSAEPLINQAADWIQSFASPAHWWTGKDAGPGADTWPAQGLGSFSSMSAPLTAAWQPALTVSLPDYLKKRRGSERKTVTAGEGGRCFFCDVRWDMSRGGMDLEVYGTNSVALNIFPFFVCSLCFF